MPTTPRILISAGQDQHTAPYEAAVRASGGVPIVRRPADGLAAYLAVDADGIVFAGGASIAPERYGAGYEAGVQFEPEDARDEVEFALLESPSTAALPLLGICRGQQLLNVAHGGSLWQHLPDHPLADDHWPEVERHAVAHRVRAAGGRLTQILGVEDLEVNSIHHQAVRALAPGFLATVHTSDGLVEGIESADGRILAVQWHPEELAPHQAASRALFTDLIARASQRAGQRSTP